MAAHALNPGGARLNSGGLSANPGDEPGRRVVNLVAPPRSPRSERDLDVI